MAQMFELEAGGFASYDLDMSNEISRAMGWAMRTRVGSTEGVLSESNYDRVRDEMRWPNTNWGQPGLSPLVARLPFVDVAKEVILGTAINPYPGVTNWVSGQQFPKRDEQNRCRRNRISGLGIADFDAIEQMVQRGWFVSGRKYEFVGAGNYRYSIYFYREENYTNILSYPPSDFPDLGTPCSEWIVVDE